MSIGIELILSTTLVATPPACEWSHPGANPYRGDPVAALADFDLPPATRAALRDRLRAHAPTDAATITRDDIVGENGAYADLREMHSGHGRVCHGVVDRSAWSATRREKALVYCAGDACVIVPAICHNVSLVSRKPEHAAEDDGPIDIEPAAGPPAPLPPPSTPPQDAGPPGFVPTPGDGAGVPPVGESVPPGIPVDGLPPIGDGGGAPPSDIPPLIPPPDEAAPCCDSPPGTPGWPLPPGTSPIAPVPESPGWAMLLAGLALLWPWRRALRAPAQSRSRNGCACAGHGDAKKASTIARSTSATVAGFQRGA